MIWIITSCILSITSVILAYYAVKFALILLKMEDAIEQSLDTLDERYSSISKVLQVPLFYDSPEIRKVLRDIKKSQEAILRVANVLTGQEENEEQEDDTA